MGILTMNWLGGEPYSEKWWSSSVGMMTFATEWKNKIHVPNHQPVISFGFLEMLELSQNLDGFVQSATGWKWWSICKWAKMIQNAGTNMKNAGVLVEKCASWAYCYGSRRVSCINEAMQKCSVERLTSQLLNPPNSSVCSHCSPVC